MAFLIDQALGYLRDAHSHGRLAHAFLFSGPDGSGKRQLVADFFSVVNAEKTDKADFHEMEPESKSRKILVNIFSPDACNSGQKKRNLELSTCRCRCLKRLMHF